MRMWPKKIVYVVCEGSSDAKYLLWLSGFFKNNNIPLVLQPHSVGTGDFSSVKAKYKNVFRKASQDGSKPEVIIWMDKDIYLRNDRRNGIKYKQKTNLPDFRFSYMNYEDFLTLHDDELLGRWTAVCHQENHFSIPMKAERYERLFKAHVFSGYQKGSLPEEFVCLDDNEKAALIRAMLTNNKRAEESRANTFRCDFASYLAEQLTRIKDTVSDEDVVNFMGKLLPVD